MAAADDNSSSGDSSSNSQAAEVQPAAHSAHMHSRQDVLRSSLAGPLLASPLVASGHPAAQLLAALVGVAGVSLACAIVWQVASRAADEELAVLCRDKQPEVVLVEQLEKVQHHRRRCVDHLRMVLVPGALSTVAVPGLGQPLNKAADWMASGLAAGIAKNLPTDMYEAWHAFHLAAAAKRRILSEQRGAAGSGASSPA